MANYFVSRHRPTKEGEQWGISATIVRKRQDGSERKFTVAAGTVTRLGDSYDVRTDAGAKCFRGEESYDVRMDAVREWREGQ